MLKVPLYLQTGAGKGSETLSSEGPAGRKLKEYLAAIDRTEMNTNDFLVMVNQGLEKPSGTTSAWNPMSRAVRKP